MRKERKKKKEGDKKKEKGGILRQHVKIAARNRHSAALLYSKILYGGSDYCDSRNHR